MCVLLFATYYQMPPKRGKRNRDEDENRQEEEIRPQSRSTRRGEDRPTQVPAQAQASRAQGAQTPVPSVPMGDPRVVDRATGAVPPRWPSGFKYDPRTGWVQSQSMEPVDVTGWVQSQSMVDDAVPPKTPPVAVPVKLPAASPRRQEPDCSEVRRELLECQKDNIELDALINTLELEKDTLGAKNEILEEKNADLEAEVNQLNVINTRRAVTHARDVSHGRLWFPVENYPDLLVDGKPSIRRVRRYLTATRDTPDADSDKFRHALGFLKAWNRRRFIMMRDGV